MARRFQRKVTSPPKHLRIDVTLVKAQCICTLNGLCLCPPFSNSQAEIKNGVKENEKPSSSNTPLS